MCTHITFTTPIHLDGVVWRSRKNNNSEFTFVHKQNNNQLSESDAMGETVRFHSIRNEYSRLNIQTGSVYGATSPII
jgi:hypothetical protein